MDWSFSILIGAAVSATVGALLGQARGRTADGAFLSAFLGPIGWLLIALGPDGRCKCPHCRAPVPDGASVCCHCTRELVSAPAARPPEAQPVPQPQPLPPAVATAPAPVVTDYYLRERQECPACGMMNPVTAAQMTTGLRCARCQVGWVPLAAKR